MTAFFLSFTYLGSETRKYKRVNGSGLNKPRSALPRIKRSFSNIIISCVDEALQTSMALRILGLLVAQVSDYETNLTFAHGIIKLRVRPN